jgi:hypothetical protein
MYPTPVRPRQPTVVVNDDDETIKPIATAPRLRLPRLPIHDNISN